jgi:hypothetical protein
MTHLPARSLVGKNDQPDQERDVIVQEIQIPSDARWTVFVGLEPAHHGLLRGEAESAGKALAASRGITAWLRLGPGEYKRL